MASLHEKKPLLQKASADDVTVSGLKTERNYYMEPILMTYMMAVMAQMPVINQFLYYKYGLQHNYTFTDDAQSTDTCKQHKNTTDPNHDLQATIESEAATFNLYLQLAAGLPAIFMTVLIGPYSDVKGRRIAIVLPLFGNLVKASIYLAIIYFELAIEYLIIGSLIEGLSGSWPTMLMGCISYIADISTREKRALRILVLEAGIAIGALVSTLSMGYWLKTGSYWQPYLAIVPLFLVNTLVAAFVLPETIERADVKISLFNATNLRKLVYVYKSERNNRKNNIALLMCILFLATPMIMTSTYDTLYQLNAPFCWTSVIIGWYTALSMLAVQFANILGLKVLVKIGFKGADIGILCAISALGCNVLKGAATTNWMMYAAAVIGLFKMMIIPILRAMLSKIVESHEQGSLFAGIAILENTMTLIGGLMWSGIYSSTVATFPGTMYMVMGGLYIGVCTLFILHKVTFPKKKKVPTATLR